MSIKKIENDKRSSAVLKTTRHGSKDKQMTKLGKKSTDKGLTKKQRRLLKIKSKPHPDLVQQILPLWEEFRNQATGSDRRNELIDQVLELSKDKLPDLAMAQDTSRVIESVIQLGTTNHRSIVFTQLRPRLRLLAKSRYARFIVGKLVKYGLPDHRLAIFKSFRGHVQRLATHKFACECLDAFYNEHANARQRAVLMSELSAGDKELNSPLSLLDQQLADRQSADQPAPSLQSRLESMVGNEPACRSLLSDVNITLLNAVTKGLEKYTMIQHLLLIYFEAIVKRASASQSKAASSTNQSAAIESSDQLISLLDALFADESLNHLVNLLTTREGVRAALIGLALAPTRLRKACVKGVKTCVASLSRSPHGHWFLLGLLDFVDDFVLLDKVVIKELVDDLDLIIAHPESRKVLLYALAPRDRRHFSPQLQSRLLVPCDAINTTTKKPLGFRAYELRNSRLLPSLLELVASDRLRDFVSPPADSSDVVDSGRLILLGELLIAGAPHNLQLTNLLPHFKRSCQSEEQEETPSSTFKSAQLDELRLAALTNFVDRLLRPDFVPLGDAINVSSSHNTDRDQLRIKRRRLAIGQAEQAMEQAGKPKFKTFESGIENDDEEEEEVAAVSDSLDDLVRSKSQLLVKSHFLERPDGNMVVRRLLTDAVKNGDLTLANLIVERVSANNLRAWTQCNRSCFILVKLFEFNNTVLSDKLKRRLGSCKSELESSSMPGAKILLKYL